VSEGLQKQAGYRGRNQCVQACGVEFNTFFPIERQEARKLLGWDAEGKYILFAGSFYNEVKNSSLAKAAVSQIEGVHLIELRGYNREQVNMIMNAVNCLLMTSHREGSPQVVKEAMSCGTPVVSVDVGDVKYNMADVEGSFISSRDVIDITKKIQKAIAFQGKTEGRNRIIEYGFSNDVVSKRLLKIYSYIDSKNSKNN
jgi:glycosyltransferase involved in cell wall biosynthesis